MCRVVAVQESRAHKRKEGGSNHRLAAVRPSCIYPRQLNSGIYKSTLPTGTKLPGHRLLIAAAMVMPWLSAQKRALAAKTNSGSLMADAVQSSMCAYLAWIALGGLVVNALFKLSWADPTAALLLL